MSQTSRPWLLAGQSDWPLPGPDLQVVAILGDPSHPWSWDRLAHYLQSGLPGWMLAYLPSPLLQGPDLLRPLSHNERDQLKRKGRSSRPGPSGWKLAFLDLFPGWAQDVYWLSLDIQRATGMMAPCSCIGLQLNAAKPKEGWRPLKMLEECFKAVEGPVTKRLASERALLPPGSVYSQANQACHPKVQAAVDVLVLDTLLVEDATAHDKPMCRIPTNYEKKSIASPSRKQMQFCRPVVKFGNSTSRPSATSKCRCRRGGGHHPRGLVLFRLRNCPKQPRIPSFAYVKAAAGRTVSTACYVDDAEHYGAGARDLDTILSDLGTGSHGTGIGFAWSKCTATPPIGMNFWPRGKLRLTWTLIRATCSDIWQGGMCSQRLPRSLDHSAWQDHLTRQPSRTGRGQGAGTHSEGEVGGMRSPCLCS